MRRCWWFLFRFISGVLFPVLIGRSVPQKREKSGSREWSRGGLGTPCQYQAMQSCQALSHSPGNGNTEEFDRIDSMLMLRRQPHVTITCTV
jgi:hypothetical protein